MYYQLRKAWKNYDPKNVSVLDAAKVPKIVYLENRHSNVSQGEANAKARDIAVDHAKKEATKEVWGSGGGW